MNCEPKKCKAIVTKFQNFDRAKLRLSDESDKKIVDPSRELTDALNRAIANATRDKVEKDPEAAGMFCDPHCQCVPTTAETIGPWVKTPIVIKFAFAAPGERAKIFTVETTVEIALIERSGRCRPKTITANVSLGSIHEDDLSVTVESTHPISADQLAAVRDIFLIPKER